MKVVILCGGKGTRLREETEYRPKPMVPIGGRPILWHIMKTYAAQGHKEFILCLGYRGEVIRDFFRNYLWMMSDVTLKLGRTPELQFHTGHDEEDWTVTLAETGDETMTGGRIKRIQPYLQGDNTFLMTYGDGVGDIDVNRGIEFHKQHGRIATLTAVRPPGRFGELGMDGNRVATFNEKAQAGGGWINGGYFVLSNRVFDYLHDSERVMFEHAPMRRLASEGELMAFHHEGFWQPMDTYQEYLLLNQLWSEGRAPWKRWNIQGGV